MEWGKKVYNIVSALFSFIIPLLIMGTAYGLISGTITRKSKDFRGKYILDIIELFSTVVFFH